MCSPHSILDGIDLRRQSIYLHIVGMCCVIVGWSLAQNGLYFDDVDELEMLGHPKALRWRRE